MRKIIIGGVCAALILTACGGDSPDQSGRGSDAAKPAGNDRTYDVSGVKKVDEIANLLPSAIKDKGKLVIGASIDYAPAEFRAADLQTPIGYEIDLGKALGKVLGVETEVSPGEFASLLPGIGSKYDLGISAFTITDERTASYTMISISEVGSSFAAKTGNPKGFDPANLCGKAIAVQNGTWQHEDLQMRTKKCTDGGMEPINVLVYSSHSDAATNVIGGKADAFYADSTVASYASVLTNKQIEVVGDVIDSAPQGIVVAKDDPALTEAVQKAMQHLMDEGTYDKIMASWGTEGAALPKAEIYPKQ
ncbi:ABC transporter substrate-binding protein [uncultured Tessaracoccus sp.]|uniref:ABC transporter substrate-binding protein n=1 Tax=uncultured Tessaracoccus sp. TaxID=905023 RepID=UPI00260C2359|nr:ABC transporter substrate-binding protein [uncultured Tessaracoccus sp.]